MAPNRVERDVTIKQLPIPERMEFEAPWTIADPDGVDVEIHLWADRGRRDGQIRILDGILLGTIAEVSRDKATLDPDPNALKRYGTEWTEAQLLYGQALLASRLSS